jgi:hypothetical protein
MCNLSMQIIPRKQAPKDLQYARDEVARLSQCIALLNNPTPEQLKDLTQMHRAALNLLVIMEQNIAAANSNFNNRD